MFYHEKERKEKKIFIYLFIWTYLIINEWNKDNLKDGKLHINYI